MPRHARILSEKMTYHVMMRGNNKEKVFLNDKDKNKMINILQEKKMSCNYYLFAYCIMDNHIHLILRQGIEDLPTVIKKIAVSYAHYYNIEYGRVGHVFQDRYRSENIDSDRYLLAAVRYIHQNPLKAGLGPMETYRWSSYAEYLNGSSDLIEIKEVLSIISENEDKALNEFIKMHYENIEDKFIDIEENKRIDYYNVNEYISNFLEERNLCLSDLKKGENKSVVQELIQNLLCESNFSKRKIAEIIGLNREIVRKITLLSREPSP